MTFHINHKRIKSNIDPDEIFLDSKNLPNFNTQQFEGRLEKAIPKRSIFILELFFIFIFIIFVGKLTFLQIVMGRTFFVKSENNILKKEPIISPRGLIYDRNGVLLAWNTWNNSNPNSLLPPKRNYYNFPGFGLLLGYVSYPAKDSSGYYWRNKYIGRAGVEESYNNFLSGTNGAKITESNVRGKIQSQNIISKSIAGRNIRLTIDSRIQKEMYQAIASMAKKTDFSGGAGVIMNIKTGGLIALTSYPEYNSNILSNGKDAKIIHKYFSDNRKVFLNRAISGLYAPGSIVKPFIAYGALNEGVISPSKLILTTGSISIPDPYFPGRKTIFRDHGSFGYINLEKAIAISSDAFFYEIGGGYQNQKGLGILNIDKYMKMFGVGQKTGIDLEGEINGIVPSPAWKARTFNGDIWRIGDTYNSSIGQYGFLVTPIQMATAIAGIADYGIIPTPHIKLKDDNFFKFFKSKDKVIPININEMKIIQTGMRMAVTEGTARYLNIPAVKVAAKSGTAQIGYGNTNTNSWIIGFFPYDNPKYSFAILLEHGPKTVSGNATYVMMNILKYMSINTPEYFK